MFKLNDLVSVQNSNIHGKITYMEDGYIEVTTTGGTAMSYENTDNFVIYVPPKPEEKRKPQKIKKTITLPDTYVPEVPGLAELLSEHEFDSKIIIAAALAFYEKQEKEYLKTGSGDLRLWTALTEQEKLSWIAHVTNHETSDTMLTALNNGSAKMMSLKVVALTKLNKRIK